MRTLGNPGTGNYTDIERILSKDYIPYSRLAKLRRPTRVVRDF